MRRYLVVANQTLGGDQLVQAVRERMLHERSEFWVLVPATKPAHFAERSAASHPIRMSGDRYAPQVTLDGYDEVGASLAQQRLDTELQRLHEVGAEADGEVGDADPYKAVGNTLKDKRFDEILVSTLPHARSRWLRQELPAKLKKFGLPVTHVVSN
jgi:GABA permease